MTKFKLPQLKYGYNELEPMISRTTMQLHHSKHHQAYIDNLNKALKDCRPNIAEAELTLLSLTSDNEQLNCSNKQVILNNAGGHYNHSLFWSIIGPQDMACGQPSGELAKIIVSRYGNFQSFVDQFSDEALKRFGSGWVFLLPDGNIVSTPNQDTPMLSGLKEPILGLDVWEHAYYLDYQNRRAEYIKAWWDVINWSAVQERFSQKNTQ